MKHVLILHDGEPYKVQFHPFDCTYKCILFVQEALVSKYLRLAALKQCYNTPTSNGKQESLKDD
jgi:hypothetical protein